MKVIVSKSFYIEGKIKSIQFNVLTKDFKKFKNQVKESALFLSHIKGQVDIQESKKHLYINYLNVKNTNHIDTLYIKQEEQN
jgi:hypothetical protein